MYKNEKRHKNADLYRAVLSLKTQEECADFFEDLCTITELRAMEQRFEVAVLLEQGYIYNDILGRTGVSSATISRVNRSLRYGAGGYLTALGRLGLRRSGADEKRLDNDKGL